MHMLERVGIRRLSASVLAVLLSFASAEIASAQNAATITGSVTNEAGQPLFGAGVGIEALAIQVGTGEDGRYTITVPGVSQGGIFYANDTICTVEDEIHNVKGLYYVSAVRMNRDMQGGTSTTLTIKEKGLLAA